MEFLWQCKKHNLILSAYFPLHFSTQKN